MRRVFLLTALLLLVRSSVTPAQVMPTTVRRGANAPLGLSMSDGEPISYVLEHAGLLDLTDEQRTALMNIRRILRRVNEPYMQRLDSLRELVGLSMEPRRLDGDDRARLTRFDSLSRPVTDTIRANNEAANLQARALLDSAQVLRLDSIIIQDRGGRGEGRRGRPPRD